MGPNFGDEMDATFFDQIDDLIEFPPENDSATGALMGSGDCSDFPSMWNDALTDSDPLFPVSHGNSDTGLSELSIPYDEIAQLEWLSTFVEDSFSGGGMTIGKENLGATIEAQQFSHNQFQTLSPVSVLESSSSSSSSGGKIMRLSPAHRGPQKARSKRPRPATFSPPATTIQLISPQSSFIETPHPFSTPKFLSDAESPPKKKFPKINMAEPKKKKLKVTFPVSPDEISLENTLAQPVRKCMHCEITKTPQWRSGPMGPKSLCNACGVRYKSGRLFPEYRPAASPTFVPSVHSNSHKKVVEMRSKFGPEPTVKNVKTEFIPTPLV